MWRGLLGRNTVLGLEDDAVGIVFNDNLLNSIGAENVQRVEQFHQMIANGEITVSTSMNLSPAEIARIVAGRR